ncbi:hypothetical protein L6452_01730 [Arctium lappa]|uniref:Uncharacterized protein n=1 Tax=Arctium lappa TaxID=4217 RepID=A0ACB9FIS7_ARCLA|nr:hypothetical protein L6452_01730 [Arctium lappa]
MANSSISAIYTAGSLTKPPTLLRDEYPQWKIRMVNFLEGMDRDLLRSVNDGPHQPMVLVPRVPATADTAEIPAYYEKKTSNFTDEETNMMDNDSKVVRLLIMTIPNDIFQELDSCVTAKEIWDQLLNQLEGGLQTQKNRRNLCINEYHDFLVLPEETLHQTYLRKSLKEEEMMKKEEEIQKKDFRKLNINKSPDLLCIVIKRAFISPIMILLNNQDLNNHFSRDILNLRGHYSANCRGRLIKDEDYYKNKYKYNVKERVLVAEMEDWLSDSTSNGEEEPTNLCGMAFTDDQSDGSSEDYSEKVNSPSTSESDLELDVIKLTDEFQILKQKLVEEKEKAKQMTKDLNFYKREKDLLESEKRDIFVEKSDLEKAQKQKEKSFSEKFKELEKVLKVKEEEVKKSEYERLNSVALTNFFQKEREILHQSLERKELQIKSYLDAQDVHIKINSQMDTQGLGFNELDPFTGLKKTSLSSTFCKGKVQSPDYAPLYSPISDECIRTTFADDIMKINQENIIADLEKKESMKRIIKVSRSKKIEKPSEVVVSGKTKRDFLDSDSESDPEADEQIFYKPEKVIHRKIDTVGSGILNIHISVLKIKPRIPICPDFAEMCLQAKTSLELEKELQEKAKNKTITSQLYTYKPIKFTPGQKGKWQENNHYDPVCAVSNKEKRMFLNKRSQLEKKAVSQAKRKAVVRNTCNIPSTNSKRNHNVPNAFNEMKSFTSTSSCSVKCNCIQLLMKLKNHFKGSHCFLNQSLNKNLETTPQKKKDNSAKTSKDKKAKFQNDNQKSNKVGPIMRWVPKKI